MADSLHFDLNDIRAQIKEIERISSELRSAADSLTDSLDILRKDWDSSAGSAFFSKYDATWLTKIENYCELLDELADGLRKSDQTYSPIEAEYNKVTL